MTCIRIYVRYFAIMNLGYTVFLLILVYPSPVFTNCPAGKRWYCLAWDDWETVCYSYDCVSCKTGTYGGGGTTTYCNQCPAGTYSGEGWASCKNCGEGPYTGYGMASCNTSKFNPDSTNSASIITPLDSSTTNKFNPDSTNSTSIITPLDSSTTNKFNPDFTRADVCAFCALIWSFLNFIAIVMLYLRVINPKSVRIVSDGKACVGNVSDRVDV